MEDIIPRRKVTGVKFGILSPEEMRQMSYVNITMKDSIENGIYKENSAYDPRLGVITNEMRCETCGLDSNRDAGHFGYIELAKPVFNPEFMKQILNVLVSSCFRCGGLLIPDYMYDEIMKKVPRKKRLAYIEGVSKKVMICPRCSYNKFPTYKISDVYKILYKFKSETKSMFLPPEYVLSLFRTQKNRDIEFLGFDPSNSRPEWFILQAILVPPPSIRPVIQNNDYNKSEDNLFKLYSLIIKINETLRDKLMRSKEPMDKLTYPHKGIYENFELLCYHITSLMNDSLSKKNGGGIVYQKSSKALKSIKEILKTKEGLIRGNIMGKRVDFTSRTVISPDVNLDVDGIGIPLLVAKKLTFPEYVTSDNLERLRNAVLNGNEIYPGVFSVHKAKTGVTILLIKMEKVMREKISQELALGDMVRRHLIDGDITMFNRQPSLHKYSYMGFRIKVLPSNNTFVFNTCTAKSFNADFDGDEMVIKLPQSLTTRNEVQQLMMARNHFVSIGNSETLITPIQDNVLGAYLMTKYGDKTIDRELFMHLVSASQYFDYSRIPGNRKTFRLIECIEVLFPNDFNINEKGIKILNGRFIPVKVTIKKQKDEPADYQRRVLAVQEKLLEGDMWIQDETIEKLVGIQYGFLTGEIIKNVLIKNLFHNYGPNMTNNFVIGLQKLVNRFLMIYGSSCSINDLLLDKNLKSKLKKNIYDAQIEVYKLLDDIDSGKVVTPLTKTHVENYEEKVREVTGKYLKENNDLVSEYIFSQPWNNIANMIKSGSKGSILNMIQIVDNVGQQSIMGKRIEKTYGERSLPHYCKFDESPEGRGFISNSFIDGLDAIECFNHLGASRIGLMDTSLKTSDSGYISRKMIQFMEDIVVRYDNFLRRGDGRIVMFMYGGNGFDPSWVFNNEIDIYDMNDENFEKVYV